MRRQVQIGDCVAVDGEDDLAEVVDLIPADDLGGDHAIVLFDNGDCVQVRLLDCEVVS